MQREQAILAGIMGALEMAYELFPPAKRPNVPEVKAAFGHLWKLMGRGKLSGVLVRSFAHQPADPSDLTHELWEAILAENARKAAARLRDEKARK